MAESLVEDMVNNVTFNLLHSVFHHFTPEGFSINNQNHLALLTVKAISNG